MKRIGWAVVVMAALGFAWYVSSRPMDFRVYYYGAQGVLDGSRPVYGERSGLGWPMHYRYPPLFLFLAAPFTALPLTAAAALWALLKCAALALLVHALWKRLGPARSPLHWLIPLLLAGPYVVEDLRYGNAQSFIFALTGAALLALPAAPLAAAFALALAISIKVWPLYLLPLLVVRREWRTVIFTVLFVAGLTLLPAFYFGFGENMSLLAEWTRQEFSTQTSQAEIWFPSQSLRGVMMRYLTAIDYSQVPDSNYPAVHIATLDAQAVRLLWMAVGGLIYCGLLVLVARYHGRAVGRWEAAAFATLVLLQPFSQKYALVVLLWPAMVAVRAVAAPRLRALLYVATAVTFVQPLIKGAAAQRLIQVLGFDFLSSALLAAFVLAMLVAPDATE